MPVIKNSKPLLEANGLHGNHDIMAGIFMNEGGNNEARRILRKEFLGQARTENKDRALSKSEIEERSLQIGIDTRVRNYERMSELLARQESLDAQERVELGELQKQNLPEFVHPTMGSPTMGKLRGMSAKRFEGLYAPGQRRFEAHHYAKYRERVDKIRQQLSKSDVQKDAMLARTKLRSPLGVSMPMKEVAMKNPELLRGDYDVLADFSTSYGLGQIMGFWGYSGHLKANKPNGGHYQVGLDDLKDSANRFIPSTEDVAIATAYIRGVSGRSRLPTTGQGIAAAYNGNRASPSYGKKVDQNAAIYRSVAAKRRPTVDHAPAKVGEHSCILNEGADVHLTATSSNKEMTDVFIESVARRWNRKLLGGGVERKD